MHTSVNYINQMEAIRRSAHSSAQILPGILVFKPPLSQSTLQELLKSKMLY